MHQLMIKTKRTSTRELPKCSKSMPLRLGEADHQPKTGLDCLPAAHFAGLPDFRCPDSVEITPAFSVRCAGPPKLDLSVQAGAGSGYR